MKKFFLAVGALLFVGLGLFFVFGSKAQVGQAKGQLADKVSDTTDSARSASANFWNKLFERH